MRKIEEIGTNVLLMSAVFIPSSHTSLEVRIRLHFIAFIWVSIAFSTLALVPTKAEDSALYFQVARRTVTPVMCANALGLHCPPPHPGTALSPIFPKLHTRKQHKGQMTCAGLPQHGDM